MKKPLAIGVEDYKRIIDKPYYYIDKTRMIKDLLDKGSSVNLFTRPRRFGKTLSLTMLKTYFEMDTDINGIVTDNRHYFDGMKIMDAGEEYTRHIGQYPVIFLSLKSAKQPTFQIAYECLIEQIALEYKRHAYILKGNCLLPEDEEKYRAIMGRRATDSAYATSLAFLCECLKTYHKKNVIILLDEYDVPLENSYFQGFYDQMISFIRSLFESALKTNANLEFAVITGCLRISKESIFTGLNNLNIISILNKRFSEYFGFTQNEVDELLSYYEITEKRTEVTQWYDGYLFGNTEIYNPWSVINYVSNIAAGDTHYPKPYWSNTSSNSIIRELVESADDGVKGEIEELIAGGTIEKPIHDAESNLANRSETTDEPSAKRFFEINEYEPKAKYEFSEKNIFDLYGISIWNFLFFTGYLKAISQHFKTDTIYLTMTIPNEEIRYIYRNTIQEWFEQRQKSYDFTPFYEGIKNGNCKQIEDFINEQLAGSISYYDNAEQFYHGYLFGILSGTGGYELLSNREQGMGRPDIIMKPFHPKNSAIIIELKRVQKFSQMESACTEALKQIDEQNYTAELLDDGYQFILKYGFCFCRKSCMVMVNKTTPKTRG